jgi:general stress protein CsbA
MSDNQQLAHTGAGVLVIGTTVITGWWLLGIALTVVLIGAVCIRFGFRPGRGAGQS